MNETWKPVELTPSKPVPFRFGIGYWGSVLAEAHANTWAIAIADKRYTAATAAIITAGTEAVHCYRVGWKQGWNDMQPLIAGVICFVVVWIALWLWQVLMIPARRYAAILEVVAKEKAATAAESRAVAERDATAMEMIAKISTLNECLGRSDAMTAGLQTQVERIARENAGTSKVELVRKSIERQATNHRGIETKEDMNAWSAGTEILMRRLVSDRVCGSFFVGYAHGDGELDSSDKQYLAQSVASLRAIAANLQQDHLIES